MLVPGRWISIGFGGLALLGCKDVLGLRELKFEDRTPATEEEREVPKPVITEGTGGGDPVNLGPPPVLEFLEPLAQHLELFPSYGRGETLFVALAPSDPRGLRFYESQRRPVHDAYELPASTSHLLHFETTTGPRLLAYSTTSGQLSVFESEAEEPRTELGSPGWTTLTLGPPWESPRLLAYDAVSGQFRLGSAVFEASSEPPLLGELPPGFDAVSLLDERTALLFSDATRFWEVWDLDATPEKRAEGSFAGTHLFAIHDAEAPAILGYDAETGKVGRYVLDTTLAPPLREEDTGVWPRSLGEFAPHAASSSVFLYNPSTGWADRKTTNPLEESPVTIK